MDGGDGGRGAPEVQRRQHNRPNKEKAPAARPGLGWDLTDRTIMVARPLHNVHFLDDG